MTAVTELISIGDAEDLIRRALMACGVRKNAARSVGRALVAAEAEGQVGHGFSRLADYAAQAQSGKVDPSAVPNCTEQAATSVVVDAKNGFAFPALDTAIEWGVPVAYDLGCATMSVTRSHHCGALSIQVEKIANAGLIGLMVANSPPAIAPWGSAVPMFGTNPIAFSAPRRSGPPLVIDLSLSRVARGKIMPAKKSGRTIPEGWALDKDGHATTNPAAALEGSMVPIGEAKGTALALMVEVLAAVLTGANPSTGVSSFFTADGPPPGAGQFLMAIKPGDESGFAQRLEAVLSQIETLDGARLPGRRRAQAIERTKAKGIEVPRHYLDDARKLAG